MRKHSLISQSDSLRPQDASRAGTNKMPTLDDQSPHKRLSMLPVARPLFGRKQNCGNLLETGSRVVGVDSPQGEQLLRQSIMLARRSEEHTSELQSLMRISYAVFCLKKKNKHNNATSQRKASTVTITTNTKTT